MAMVVLDVAGIRDDDGAKTIQQAISARDPDAVVVVMRIAGRVSVDTTLRPDELVEAVAAAGYRASLAFEA